MCGKDGNIFYFSGTPTSVRRQTSCASNKTVAYLPELKKDIDVKGDADYDENSASAFFALTTPTANLPEGGPSAISSKLEFCLDVIKDWDPRFHETMKLIDDEDAIHVFQARASVQPKANWRQNAKTVTDPKRGNVHVWLMGDSIHPMFPLRFADPAHVYSIVGSHRMLIEPQRHGCQPGYARRSRDPALHQTATQHSPVRSRANRERLYYRCQAIRIQDDPADFRLGAVKWRH